MSEVIATNQVYFPIMANVYESTDEYVIASVGSAYADSKEYVGKKKPRQYKLYYHDKRESYYFVKDGRKFWLDETLRRF
jgi:hypothetical protein